MKSEKFAAVVIGYFLKNMCGSKFFTFHFSLFTFIRTFAAIFK
jgi:hypothetical protein